MLSLVVDIRSDIIEGTLVQFGPVPKILYATSAKIPHKPHTDGDYLTKMMLKGLEDLCKHVNHEGLKYAAGLPDKKITTVYYILSSPWVISQSKTVKVDYGQETEITEKVIQGIINENRTQLEKQYEADMVFIEEKIFAVELNGYPVQDYRGKEAKTLKVSFAFTLSSDTIIKKIQAASDHLIHLAKEEYHSSILLHYLASRARAKDDKDYILAHIHGEITEMTVVKKGISTYLGSFPFGTSTLVRKVSHSLRSGIETTASTLAMYADGKLETTQQTRVENSVSQIIKGWQSDFVKDQVGLPHIVTLSSPAPQLPLFKKVLSESGFQVVVDTTPLPEMYISVLNLVL